MMRIPSAYAEGYELARALDPERARNYVAHAVIGDSEADGLMEELSPLGHEELGRLVQIGMDGDERALRDVPAVLREFFESCAVPPGWLDLPGHMPGIRMFHRNSRWCWGRWWAAPSWRDSPRTSPSPSS